MSIETLTTLHYTSIRNNFSINTNDQITNIFYYKLLITFKKMMNIFLNTHSMEMDLAERSIYLR